MHGRRKILAFLGVVLLLAAMLPLGALAAQGVPDQITASVVGMITPQGDECCIDFLAINELQAAGTPPLWNDGRDYRFSWKLHSTLDPKKFEVEREYYSAAAFYDCSKQEAQGLVGQNLCRCEVSYQGAVITTITFRLEKLVYAPNIGELRTEHLYFDPGKPLTVTLVKKPTIVDGGQLLYSWELSDADDGRSESLADALEKPTITFTPTAGDEGRILSCYVARKDVNQYIYSVREYVLVSREKKPVIMPSPDLIQQFAEYELALGQSKTLAVPAARAGDAGKALEYRWYMDGETTPYAITSTPQLTVTNTTGDDERHFIECWVGYRGKSFAYPGISDFLMNYNPSSGFCLYDTYFDLHFLPGNAGPNDPNPPASTVPKTGNGTPLAMLYALLAASAAAAAKIIDSRRRHGL